MCVHIIYIHIYAFYIYILSVHVLSHGSEKKYSLIFTYYLTMGSLLDFYQRAREKIKCINSIITMSSKVGILVLPWF